jgi:hypothetical protein
MKYLSLLILTFSNKKYKRERGGERERRREREGEGEREGEFDRWRG